MSSRIPLLSRALVLGALALPCFSQGVMLDLGNFGGLVESVANGVSADGLVAVGYSYGPNLTHRAFRWEAATGMQDIGDLGGSYPAATANAADADGDVVVGDSNAPSGQHAFRWVAPASMQDLGTLGGQFSTARSVSADGAVVAGFSHDSVGHFRAMRWTAATGMQDLGTLGGTEAYALRVSADGSIVVGSSNDAAGRQRAFRWSAGGGMLDLGTLGGNAATATGTNADGSVVVGSSIDSLGQWSAFRWTATGGMHALDGLGGAVTYATGVSADGAVVVGSVTYTSTEVRAFRWSESDGIWVLGALGYVNSSGYDVNGDGSVIVGWCWSHGPNPSSAFLWRLSPLGSTYCTPVANSTGRPGELRAFGDSSVSANELLFCASSIAPGAFGYLLSSDDQGDTYPYGSSQGRLCLGGSIGRHVGPGEVQRANTWGSLAFTVDLTAVPTPLTFIALQPGDTWNFQVWYRDANPAPTSNLTVAVSIQFQ